MSVHEHWNNPINKKYSCNLGKKEGIELVKTKQFSIRGQQEIGDTIGQILVIEFDETHSGVFDEVMEVLQKHKSFETVQFKSENIVSLPGLTIYPNQRKA